MGQDSFFLSLCFQYMIMLDVWHNESVCFPLVLPANTLIFYLSTLLSHLLLSHLAFVSAFFWCCLSDVFSYYFCPFRFMFYFFTFWYDFWKGVKVNAQTQHTCLTGNTPENFIFKLKWLLFYLRTLLCSLVSHFLSPIVLEIYICTIYNYIII